MFDLNELPENEGPAGRASALLYSFAVAGGRGAGGRAATAKAEDAVDVAGNAGRRVVVDEDEEEEDEEEDVEEDDEEDVDEEDDDDEEEDEEVEQQVYYSRGKSSKIVCRVLGDDQGKKKEPPQSFLRLDNPPTIRYPNNWQPSGLTTFDENDEIDTDNEVTVAALDARAILDSQIVRRLDSAVSLVVPTEPTTASFGISPRSDKLGRRTEPSRKFSNFSNFHRSHPKWEGVVLEKRGNDRRDDQLKLDSGPPLLQPGLVSTTRKGKRAREQENLGSIDQVLKFKRHARPPQALVVADVYDGAGPSLSISLDHDAHGSEGKPFSTSYKVSNKGEVSGREGTSLSLGESSLAGFEYAKRVAGHRSVGSKSNGGLSMSAMSATAKVENSDKVESNLQAVPSVGDYEEGDKPGFGTKRNGWVATLGDAGRVEASEKPVWQGKLIVHGYSTTDVAAYCSVDLQPASKLWRLPQAVTVENLVKIQEFFAAAKQANVIEPVMRLKLLSDGASSGPSFSSMVTILNSKMTGRGKDGSVLPEKLGRRNGSPASAAGSDYVFIASPQLNQPKGVAEKTSAKLYLVLGSSLEPVSSLDQELRKKLSGGMDWSHPLEENYLFAFLFICEEEARFNDLNRSREAKVESSTAAAAVSPTKKLDVQPTLPMTKTEIVVDCSVNNNIKPERMDAVQVISSEGEGTVAIAGKDEERTEHPSGEMQLNVSKDQKGHSMESSHEARRSETAKERNTLRHSHSSTREEGRKDRDRLRDRDRDLRAREKEKDLRMSNRDVHRYSYRSMDKVDLSNRDRSKERADRFRERSHRDSHRDLTDRSKSSRDRMKELEKHNERQRDREKEKERERPVSKRARSTDPEKGWTDVAKCELESEKAKSSAKHADGEHQLLEQSVKDSRKRSKVESEETHENEPVLSDVSTVQLEPDDANVVQSVLDAITEPAGAVPLRKAEGAGQSEISVQVTNSATAESLGDAEIGSRTGEAMRNDEDVQVDRKSQTEKADETLPKSEEQTSTPSSTHTPAHNRTVPRSIFVGPVNSVVAETCVTAQLTDHEAIDMVKEIREARLLDCGESRASKDMDKNGASQSEHSDKITKDAEHVETGAQDVNDDDVEVHCRARDAGTIEPPVQDDVCNPEERSNEAETLATVQRSKPKTLSVRVDDTYCPVDRQKSDDHEVSQDSGVRPGRFTKDNSTPSVHKSVNLGGDDQHGSLQGVESHSSATDNGSSPGLSAEVSSEILLHGCDKDTRSWVVSKQSERYLAEEFGVRIARLEEVGQSKPDSQSKAQQGPVDIKVFLVTEKSTDANEGKWFINQAAGVLQTLASRGVFTKCLWYQGQVQRHPSDQAPSIQIVVKKIKGEDGKNLEKIQEETGVMIGIVLHANNKNGLGNTSRVIGLRLKGTRKKGIQEASKQAELLLSQVAVQFSTGSRAKLFGSQDAALLKLKVDFSNNTSPSSGILTPMQKDVFAAYSPVSPVATISPLGSFKQKLDEPSTEATYTTSAAVPTPMRPNSAPDDNPTPTNGGDFGSQSQQSEDEQPDKGRRLPDLETKYPRPLLVSNLPELASASSLRELFEDVLKVKFGLPSSYEGVSDMILDVRFSPDKSCAFVEFASDELLLEVLKLYADNKPAFFGLNLELGSVASLVKLERMLLAARTETTNKGLEFGGDIMDSLKVSRSRVGRKSHKSEDRSLRVSTLRSSPETEVEVSQDHRFAALDETGSLHVGEKPSPLFLTELMRNSSARSIHALFEDVIKKYRSPSLANYKGRATVLDVRYIPSRGCAFVDLATAELADFMLDLHTRRPEVFYNMKMEIGRRPVPLGHGEEEPVVKRPSHLGRNALVEESHSYGYGSRSRGYFPSTSPPPVRRNDLSVIENDFTDDYEDEDDDERQPISARKRRSDPERTVYADRLPDSASEGMIRRIFERVLRDNMTDEQREVLGDNIITEVRYVPTKFCAFIVFVAEELTRLVLQLYNQDEEIFKNMRLKPHFHSKMEDLYREDLHDREDGPVHRALSRDMSMDRRGRRGMDDYQNGYSKTEITDHRNRNSAAHRAVAATAFKEVDRRRSVYVDRIPERLPEPTVRDLFERAMRQHRHGYRSHSVSQVTFFRDKFDPEKLCAFVELENEDMVQELLDIYMEDEEVFSGMRVRPAIKYGH